jgi:NitT/TauT family transport system ATP-binding protein
MRLGLEAIGHAYLGRVVIDRLDLAVAPGEVVALVGPSGCGKTTLLQIAAGLVDPLRGRVRRHYARHAVVFQEPRLLPWMTTAQNIGYGLRVAGRPWRDAAAQRAAEVGLAPHDLLKYPVELSGGMRQRAALARALAVDPEILFLDEPFSAVDVGLRRDLQDLLIEAAGREGFSAMLVTHDLWEAARVADRLLVMSSRGGGRVLADVVIPGRPGARGERDVFNLVEAWSEQPAFAELFGGIRTMAR